MLNADFFIRNDTNATFKECIDVKIVRHLKHLLQYLYLLYAVKAVYAHIVVIRRTAYEIPPAIIDFHHVRFYLKG